MAYYTPLIILVLMVMAILSVLVKENDRLPPQEMYQIKSEYYKAHGIRPR